MNNMSLVLRAQLLAHSGHSHLSRHALVADNLLSLANSTRINLTRDGTVTESAAADEVTTLLYDRHLPKYPQATLVSLCVILGCMIVATVLGNVFVITAILIERSLQGVSNYLVLSLAVTDLLVAVLVMPLSLLNEVSVHWYLGRALCDMWVSMDVLCCTASILHLVAIAVDRFWAVSNIDYVRRRCARQILLMITIVWLVSVAISIPPLFGWRHASDNPELSGVCMISQDHGYTIFSTVGAFYCPLVLMLVLNFKIYRAARYRIRRKRFLQRPRLLSHVPVPAVHVEQETTAQATKHNSSDSDSNDGVSVYNPSCVVNRELTTTTTTSGTSSSQGAQLIVPQLATIPPTPQPSRRRVGGGGGGGGGGGNNTRRARNREKEKQRREKLEMRRERKAARVLGIITGAFVLCWLPFFILALVGPFLPTFLHVPTVLQSLFLWLGYFNSLLNPIIYTVFNPSFRTAFRKIFFKRLKSVTRS
ncbi:5-hydroxytryptamine receptor-like [Babylonia areolata]|uniref:5-hydroxytryptamine receptor-like n=1 Tax=Babylonia areolata TaxID=304850 RepID=UPI003FD3CA44